MGINPGGKGITEQQGYLDSKDNGYMEVMR